MWLSRVSVEHCRVVTHAELTLAERVNVLYGDNASGKSSVLEALSVLSRGRSFRTPRIAELISRGKLNSLLLRRWKTVYPVRVTLWASAKVWRIRAFVLTTRMFRSKPNSAATFPHPDSPGSVELVTGSPTARRAFLDWIAFYRFADFNTAWRQYQRVLKQRNLFA